MTRFVQSTVAPLAPIVLSAALLGCREERGASQTTDVGHSAGPPIVRSLPEAVTEGREGSRVYLSHVTLVPLPPGGEVAGPPYYMVIDGQGSRMPCVLRATPDSFLWALMPTESGRSYSDFGAILERIDGSNVLAIFKLAN